MKCPACGNEDAYMGFTSIDCPNSACRHFTGNSTTTKSVATAPSPAAPSTAMLPSPILLPAPSSGATGVSIAGLSVDIKSAVPKLNSVLIELVAHGDPGNPNKSIEILWDSPAITTPRVCTLSSRQRFLLTGIDADGITVYTTHWQCVNDGIQPTDPWTLTARIF